MDSIGSILPRVLAKRGFKKEATASLITSRANDFLQKRYFSEGVRALKCQDGVVIISVETAIQAQECQMCVHELLKLLENEFNTQVKSIRIVRK